MDKKKIIKNDTTMAYVTAEDTTGSVELLVFPKVYLALSHMLQEGRVMVFSGRVSVREDEDTKIMCDNIEYPENASSAPQKNAETGSGSSKKRKGLFLRFSSEEDGRIAKAEQYLAIFDGSTPLYFYFNDTKSYKLQPAGKFVSPNEPLIRELKNLLGENNVALQ